MIRSLHGSRVDVDILASDLGCPGCGQPLAPWGYARTRSVRGHSGTVELRPRRTRCRDCRTTHVLLPAWCLPRRAVAVEVIGAALLAKVNGSSHRTIAADLGVPADTVRGWIRRATAHASWLRVCGTQMAHSLDPLLAPIHPTGTPLGDALEALGTAAAAAVRRLAMTAVSPWELITEFTRGRLLAPLPRAG